LRELAVGFSAVLDSIHDDFLGQIVNVVEDAIVTDPEAVAFASRQLDGLMGSWILLEGLKGLSDFSGEAWRKGEELFAGARLKENLVGHYCAR